MATVNYSLEREQGRSALNIIIWATLVVTLALGVFDLQFHTPVSIVTLFAASLACIPMLILNARGQYPLAAGLLSVVGLLVITANIYDGDGIHDPGVLAYPIFILGGTLLFGKRAAPYFTLAAVAAVTVIVYLETEGYIHPHIGRTDFAILIPFGTLLLLAGVIIWVILRNLEGNLQRALESEAELARSYDLTLEAWATLLEHRDRDTQGHTQRVTALTLQLAQALGLSGPALVDIRRGALLHDLGKMGMPDSVLLKRGTLTDEEWAVVRRHPALAQQLLTPIRYLRAAVDIPWCHHEKWDGTGYPRGLKGEQIPLAARIFAVADVWDAVTSERPYRAAMPKEQAREHLRSRSGSQFDPVIVQAFLELDPSSANGSA